MSPPPNSASPGESLTAAQFERVRARIVAFCGVDLSSENQIRIDRIVRQRMRALGLSHVGDYLRTLEGTDPRQELSILVDHVTNNETYFFREAFQLEALANAILPELLSRRRRRLSLWSAGCSSGEEALTLAMLLREHPLWESRLAHLEIRILGTDVNRRMIRRARAARYRPSAFKGLSADRRREVQRRFFSQVGDRFEPIPALREMVSYLHLNLLDWEGTSLFLDMDVVLCRNVLMYFPRAVRLHVLQGIYRKMVPGGFLLLGHSENLLGVETPFEPVRFDGALVYRKPQAAAADRTSRWSRSQ